MHRSSCGPTSILDGVEDEDCDDPQDTLCIPGVAAKVLDNPSPPAYEETDSDPFVEDKQGLNIDEDNDLQQEWNASLYMLQSQAPHPKCVSSDKQIESCPPHYGKEFHGYLNRKDTASVLGTDDGSYLVREALSGSKILSFMIFGRMYNYRLYYEDGLHYVGENRFEDIEDLVQDGLITLYLYRHNATQTMQEGQLETMARRKRAEKKLKNLKRSPGKRVKGLKGKKAWEYHRVISSTSLSSVRSPSPTPSPSNSPTQSPRQSFSPPYTVQATRRMVGSTATSDSFDESNLDFKKSEFRKSLPSPCLSEKLLGEEKRTNSISSLPVILTPSKEVDRYSAIISTLRDAVNQDKKKQQLKLDKSDLRLKSSSSDGRIGKFASTSNIELKTSKSGDLIPVRTYSCHLPYSAVLEKVADSSIKGTNSLSRSSMTALAKHTSGPKSPYYKAHDFSKHTYKGPTWCEICHHFLWGLKHQGMRCKDCGMDAHKQCVSLAIQLECYPNKQCIKKVFGVDLTTLVKLEGGVIPSILTDIISEIQSRDLSIEGLYRLSGQTSEILCIKEKYDDGELVSLSQYSDISVLTGTIKLYLRELPIPLITFDAYKDIMKATAAIADLEDPNIDWQHFNNVLKLLPKAHYNTLHHLAQHLFKIQAHSAENKMTAPNLSVIFAPTLMWSPNNSNTLIQDLPIQRNFVEYLILKHAVIFK